MSVLELCDADVASVPVEVSAADAIRLMLDRHVGAVGVVDSEGRVAGIFTERDVLRKLSLTGRNPEATPVRELMTTAGGAGDDIHTAGRGAGHHAGAAFSPSAGSG